MPRWKELKRFCERDGWEIYKDTDHYFYRKVDEKPFLYGIAEAVFYNSAAYSSLDSRIEEPYNVFVSDTSTIKNRRERE